MTVMLQQDYLELEELWSQNREYKGILELEGQEEPQEITVRLQKNTRYLDKIAGLYGLFLKNGIPWQTVNAPYLYKMADVILTKLPDGISGREKIRKLRIQFGSISPMIRYDLIPVWNVRSLSLNSIGFPAPCEDHRNYNMSSPFRNTAFGMHIWRKMTASF